MYVDLYCSLYLFCYFYRKKLTKGNNYFVLYILTIFSFVGILVVDKVGKILVFDIELIIVYIVIIKERGQSSKCVLMPAFIERKFIA